MNGEWTAISQAVQLLMKMRGMTQMELSHLSGVSQGHLSLVLRGERQVSEPIVERLVGPLGVTLRQLVLIAHTEFSGKRTVEQAYADLSKRFFNVYVDSLKR